jgi:GNAT superfamily N-acetyltransferase
MGEPSSRAVSGVCTREFLIDSAGEADLPDLLSLYCHLHPGDPVLDADDAALAEHWHAILADPALHYVVAREASGAGSSVGAAVVATCALALVPNLTRGARPYGLIENVVTRPDWRGRGVGTAVIQRALEVAWAADCYKVMLLSGRKDEGTLRFYEGAGFTRGEKTGFVARNPAG